MRKNNSLWIRHRLCYRGGKRTGHTDSVTKAVLQYDLLGNLVSEFKSIAEATLTTRDTNIGSVLNGKYKQSNGNIWKYK